MQNHLEDKLDNPLAYVTDSQRTYFKRKAIRTAIFIIAIGVSVLLINYLSIIASNESLYELFTDERIASPRKGGYAALGSILMLIPYVLIPYGLFRLLRYDAHAKTLAVRYLMQHDASLANVAKTHYKYLSFGDKLSRLQLRSTRIFIVLIGGFLVFCLFVVILISFGFI